MSTVHKHILDNGLTILLKEVHHAPIVSWWVLYRVGSRNERTGQTGVSHWVEHMLFKGTPKFPGGMLDREIDRCGGTWNAQTFIDYTAYYETLPATKIDMALEIEADRMVNVQFTDNDVESERTVIISERQGAENSPLFWLGEEVNAAAFRVHGYHHEIIGDMTDLETMTRADLYGYYKQHYQPNNAIAVAVGAFDVDDMLRRIEHHYGGIPAGPAPALFTRPEPPQQGERRVCVERPGNTHFLQVAYHVPAATHADWFKLNILDSVMTGPSSLGGGGIDNKTSRLYQALVKSEIAASVHGSLTPTIDPYLYELTITLRDGRRPEEAEAALNTQIERICNEKITQQELDKAKKQARALFAYGTEGVTEQAFWLAFAENFGGYEWFENYVHHLEAVTRDDVLAAAQTYLQAKSRVVGCFIPTEMHDEEDEDDYTDVNADADADESEDA